MSALSRKVVWFPFSYTLNADISPLYKNDYDKFVCVQQKTSQHTLNDWYFRRKLPRNTTTNIFNAILLVPLLLADVCLHFLENILPSHRCFCRRYEAPQLFTDSFVPLRFEYKKSASKNLVSCVGMYLCVRKQWKGCASMRSQKSGRDPRYLKHKKKIQWDSSSSSYWLFYKPVQLNVLYVRRENKMNTSVKKNFVFLLRNQLEWTQ